MTRVEAIADHVGTVIGLLLLLFFLSTSTGVVYESCADPNSRTGDVESHWTYVLLPPLTLANIDPDGSCVRHSPLRQGLSAVGIWQLPSPRQQVFNHIRDQLRNPR